MSSLDDIYIPPTHAQERDALRAEVERWKAKFADQTAILAAADADRIRLVAEVERLRSLLREVAASEVQKHYDAVTAVLIKGGLWGRLREEFDQ